LRKLYLKKMVADDIQGAEISTQKVPTERAEQLLNGREGVEGVYESR